MALVLAGCRIGTGEANQGGNVRANMAEPAPQTKMLPAPERPLDREAVLLALVRARSAAAAGADDRAAQAELDGRRFEFRIRLGCTIAPQGQPAGRFGATFDAAERRVELNAAPDLAIDHPAVAAIAADRFEAAEGFWVPQPWLLVPACPAGVAAGAPSELVGIAQFFAPTDSRVERRDGRAYVAREPLAEGAEGPAAGGWDLVIAGRLRQLTDGRVIVCRPAAQAMPACIISIEFDRVSILNVASGQQLAEWGRG